MLYHVIPCYTMLYHVIPHYTMLYHVIPRYTMLYHVIPCYTMLYHVIPCYAMLYHVIPRYTMSYHVIPCHTTLYHVIPYHTMSPNPVNWSPNEQDHLADLSSPIWSCSNSNNHLPGALDWLGRWHWRHPVQFVWNWVNLKIDLIV